MNDSDDICFTSDTQAIRRASTRAPDELQASLSNRRILIVEDEFLIAQDLFETLSACGAQVVGPVANVTAAVRLIAEEPIDCALVDLDLGGEPGYAVADALARSDIPFLFSTGYDATSIDERYRGVPTVSKPIDTWTVAWAVRNQLGS